MSALCVSQCPYLLVPRLMLRVDVLCVFQVPVSVPASPQADVACRCPLCVPGPNLRAVATLSDDTHHINIEECARRNIRVLCCPPSDLDGQADLTVALILLTLRSVVEGAYAVQVIAKSIKTHKRLKMNAF